MQNIRFNGRKETKYKKNQQLLQLIVYFYLGLYDYSVLVTRCVCVCVCTLIQYLQVCLPLKTRCEPFTCLTYVCRQQSG